MGSLRTFRLTISASHEGDYEVQVIDYGRSFIRGTAAFNRVRFWVESRAVLMDERDGTAETYWQCGACKSENTFAEKDLFHDVNYDFTPVYSEKYLVIFRRGASIGGVPPVYRQIAEASGVFGEPEYHIVETATACELKTNDEIRTATHDCLPLVSRTELWNADTGLRAIIECPVKTMNINDERNLYQVDTGPVPFLDLSQRHERSAEALSLAYVAFNAPHFADFVIEAPTPIEREGREVCRVYHYSELRSCESRNTLYAVM